MAKFTIEVEEVTRYAIEVEAEDSTEAMSIAEDQFFSTPFEKRPHLWQYAVDTNFEVVDN